MSSEVSGIFKYHTKTADVSDFGGDITRFVDFHMDNIQILSDLAICGEVIPSNITDRLMTFAWYLNKMKEGNLPEIDQFMVKYGFISRGVRIDDEDLELNLSLWIDGFHKNSITSICLKARRDVVMDAFNTTVSFGYTLPVSGAGNFGHVDITDVDMYVRNGEFAKIVGICSDNMVVVVDKNGNVLQ